MLNSLHDERSNLRNNIKLATIPWEYLKASLLTKIVQMNLVMCYIKTKMIYTHHSSTKQITVKLLTFYRKNNARGHKIMGKRQHLFINFIQVTLSLSSNSSFFFFSDSSTDVDLRVDRSSTLLSPPSQPRHIAVPQ